MDALRWNIELPELLIGHVFAADVAVQDSPADLLAELDEVIATAASIGIDDSVRAGVRDLLRGHGYKPSGRGKPANEFLAAAAARGEFPRINNVVDINNLVSLETGWPISVIDRDRVAGQALEIRHGREGERFVFNASGHEIDIHGLVCVGCVEDEAIANPVKDSMATKLSDRTRSVEAFLYTSRTVATAEAVLAATSRFGALLSTYAGANSVECAVLP